MIVEWSIIDGGTIGLTLFGLEKYITPGDKYLLVGDEFSLGIVSICSTSMETFIGVILVKLID